MTINFKSSIDGTSSDLDQLLIRKSNASIINAAYPAWGSSNSNQYGGFGDGTTISSSSPIYVSSHGPYKQMVRGYRFTFGLRYDNTLWVWGTGDGIEAGQGVSTQTFFSWGTTPPKSSPTQIGSKSTYYSNAYIPTQWKQIEGTRGESLAIASDGGLWAWGGTNATYIYGQGYGGGTYALGFQAPVKLGTDSWTAVSVGYDHYLGIKSNGTLFGWGKNTAGQVGDGTTINRYTSPITVAAGSYAVVSAGVSSSAAIKTDGSLWMWGYNQYGMIGDGTTVNKSSPVQIGTSSWSAVFAGQYSTYAIRIDGTLWSWGRNDYGQLGDGTTIDKSSPVQIGAATNWIDIKMPPASYAAFALKNDGTLWGWGMNSGQLGDGTTINRSSPVQIATRQLWNIVYTSN